MEKRIVSGILLTLFFTGMVTLAFNIQTAKASGTIYIRADGSVEGTDKIQRDGNLYTFTDNVYDEIVVERSNIIIDGNGYMLQGSEDGYGFYLSDISNVTIKNTNIKDFKWGIFLNSTSHNVLLENKIKMRAGGLQYGIYLFESSDNKISGNEIAGGEVRSSGDSCIILAFSDNNTISGNKMTGSFVGIHLEESNNNTVSGNEINSGGWSGSGGGVRIDRRSTNNTVSENDITNNGNGVLLYRSASDNKISGNNIKGNGHWYGNWYGGGICIGWSYNNTVSENNITNNGIGVFFEGESPRGYNLIYHNNFIDNTRQVYGEFLHQTIERALWDDGYPSGGNYWSDYNGTDQYSGSGQDQVGGDGIGDTPYVIDENNKDRYPLMIPWGVTVPAPPEVHVGVEAGDWIKLEYTISAGQPYPEWLKVEILSVEGTTVTVHVTMHMSDGTEQSDTLIVDVVAGGGTFDTLFGFVIPANRTTGDPITIGGDGFTFSVTIDGETTKSYAGASRTVVYASFLQYGTQLTYYWDKETGIMVEASVTSGSITGTAKATETNMWQAAPSGLPIEPTYLYILTAVIIIIAAATIVLIIRRKREPREKLQLKPT